MKFPKSYLWMLLFCAGTCFLLVSGCSRKYGCDTLQTTETKLKKDGTPRKKARTNLFGKKGRRN